MERLQKYMARHGLASRRACEEIIASGRVKVNGKTVTEMGFSVDPSRDRVVVDGRALRDPEKKIYIMLNKPRGYITSLRDPRGRKIVTDLLDGVSERVFPVGRLDYDSEGMLLLTNDGDLAFRLTHPGHRVSKTYRVRVKGIPAVKDLENLSRGVMLDDGITAPAGVSLIDEREGNALIEITITEGRNRQIRRMFEALGYEVLRLKRTKMGGLHLGELKPGQFRHLKESEVKTLKNMSSTKQECPPRRNKPFARGGIIKKSNMN
ncbi:MAG: pseudouridine synthase [Bacillota bacterium]